MLERLNKNNDYPLRIIDPADNSRTIEDPKEICKVLGAYWKNVGSGNGMQNDIVNDNLKTQVNNLSRYTGETLGCTDVKINYDNVSYAVQKLKKR